MAEERIPELEDLSTETSKPERQREYRLDEEKNPELLDLFKKKKKPEKKKKKRPEKKKKKKEWNIPKL